MNIPSFWMEGPEMGRPDSAVSFEKNETHELDDLEHISEAEDIIVPLSPIRRERSISIYFRIFHDLTVDESVRAPPSFAESQFATIVRRQKPRETALKISNVPTRYPNLTRDFEFAG